MTTINDNMLPVGTLLRGGTYRIERQLANGGFGNTYVAKNLDFDEIYVIKEFFMKGVNLRQDESVTVSVPDNRTTFESQKIKFKKEAQRLRKIHNSHIVKVHDLFEENNTIYYVMDFIDGQSLSEQIKAGKPFTEHEGMLILRQVLDALEEIHAQNPQMFHLDIKPSNLMKDSRGNVWLIDFGSSKQLDVAQGITVSSGITLTKGYAPSELEDGKKERIGAWTDLYELGATIYNLLTCNHPPTSSEILEESEKVFNYPSSISPNIKELVSWMMNPIRKERPQSVAEVKSRIEMGDIAVNADDEETVLYEDVREDTIIGGSNEGIVNGKDFHSQPVDIKRNDKEEENVIWRRAIPMIFAGVFICCLIWLFQKPNDKAAEMNDIDVKTNATSQLLTDTVVVDTSEVIGNNKIGIYNDTGELEYWYNGELENGVPNGSGKAFYVDGVRDQFLGSFVHGKRQGGFGTLTYKNGDKYEGSFRNDHFQKGIYTIKEDGSYFDGTFRNDQPFNGRWFKATGQFISTIENGKEI